MNALSQPRLTAENFVAYVQDRAGRYELFDGVVVPQAAERASHAERKLLVCIALSEAIRKRKSACHVLPDGMAVKIAPATVYEPDALVYCGAKLPPDTLLIENPTIVVEVWSPSSSSRDNVQKLAGYFGVPSLMHYLIVHPDEPLVIHHQRGEAGKILTSILREGAVPLEPLGIELDLARVYGATD